MGAKPEQVFSKAEARAIAVHAQGFNGLAEPTVLGALDHLSVFQIDSVNVFERAHYMPAFSRIGAYDRSLLDAAHSPETAADGSKSKPTLIEYWAHEAAFIRVEDLPRHLWRMRKYREKAHDVGQDFATTNRKLFEWLLAYLADQGPMTAGEVEHPANVRKPGTWWHHNDVKRALEIMFTAGQVVSAGRKGFSRRYGVPEQVLPAEVLAAMNPTSYDPSGDREYLLTLAAKRFGIATGRDLADYHRQLFTAARPHIANLVEAGTLVPCRVEGLSDVFYRHVDTVLEPPAHTATTIVSPFDPLVWHRPRTEGLFEFHYRIEIYTPEPKRIFGYYTLPILHNGQVVGRIDLKSDRQSGVLIAKASWHEAWLSASQTRELAKSLAAHLKEVAAWQGLHRVEIATRGNLAAALAKEVARV